MCVGLFTGQYITEDAMVWAEGQPEWLPLKACHELYSALVFQGTIVSGCILVTTLYSAHSTFMGPHRSAASTQRTGRQDSMYVATSGPAAT